MASTIWKGQLTFGLVSFPIRLQKAARRERIALKYVREINSDTAGEEAGEELPIQSSAPIVRGLQRSEDQREILPVRQGYFSEGQREPSSAADLQRGYEVAPDQFVVVGRDEMKSLREATSTEMQILRSVKMQEIDPVFLETSYYVIPGSGGEHSYALFYRALKDTQLAMLAQVAMHGRKHVIVLRAAATGLIAHTMFYVNEVRGGDEFVTPTTDISSKELDLATKYIEALVEPFRPEEFTDDYRKQLETLIASKQVTQPAVASGQPKKTPGKVVDIMVALRESLEAAKAVTAQRKPVASESAPESKPRRRKASAAGAP